MRPYLPYYYIRIIHP